MTSLTVDNINTLTYGQLRTECKKADLPAKGKKEALQKRLLDHLQGQKNNDNGRKSENKENTSPEVASASKKVDTTTVIYVFQDSNVQIIGTCGEIVNRSNDDQDSAKNGHYNQLLEKYGELQGENASLKLKISELDCLNNFLMKQLMEAKMQLERVTEV